MNNSDIVYTQTEQKRHSSSGSGSSLNYSSDINAISVDYQTEEETVSCNGLKYLPTWPAINLEFSNITYTVPCANGKGKKSILCDIHGEFRAFELTAIMGPSGAGKTTLLNLLAGYGANSSATGEINVNHNPRNMRIFRKMSRYIMQNDVLDMHFTVSEAMMFASHLKLGNEFNKQQKLEVIDEILSMLRLNKVKNTKALRLSGGERKRLCIAMELVNNPPVIFLDEPTTGLDDLSSSQCISLLRHLAHKGRTIICSIHTPSAKIFEMFDKVYVLTEGKCIYQGAGNNIVPFMKHIGLTCPLTYNPADFIIEVACREYGNQFVDAMTVAVNNGRVSRWSPDFDYNQLKLADSVTNKSDTTSGASSLDEESEQFIEDINPKLLKSKSSWWMQYKLLLARMLIQMWRDKNYIKLKFFMNIILGLTVGGIYRGSGNDATKGMFNVGFAFTIVIAYLYLPMMPILLQFPTEMSLLKREYFNRWYRLNCYYAALITSKLPSMLLLALIYLAIVYLLSNQPLELFRFGLLFVVAVLTAMTSDSFGLMVSSKLSLVNAMFIGPVVAVPLILLSVFGLGYGKGTYISPFMRFLMSMSYLRHGMEGLLASLYSFDRADTLCPETEIFCMFKKSEYLLTTLGFENLNYIYSVCCLIGFYLVYTILAFLLIRNRLASTRKSNILPQFVVQFFREQLHFSSYNY